MENKLKKFIVVSKKDASNILFKDKTFYHLNSNGDPTNPAPRQRTGNFILMNVENKNDLCPLHQGKIKEVK